MVRKTVKRSLVLYMLNIACFLPETATYPCQTTLLLTSCHLQGLVMSYKGKISLHFDPSSLYSCCVQSLLLREIIRICTCGLQLYSSNYSMFAHLLSFLGIQEEAALIIEVEIRSSLDLHVHFEQLHPGPFN